MFLLSTLFIVVIGFLGSYLFIKINKKDLFGGYRVGVVVGVVGAVLGGFIFDILFKMPLLMKLQELPYIKYLLVNRFDVNFIASALGAWLFLCFYEYVSKYTERS